MDDEVKKKIDENWKVAAGKEKEEAAMKQEPYHEPTFTIFLSSIAMQVMIALGKLENPLTGKTEINPEQARFLIDTLSLIKEKTKGNLTSEEEKFLNESLYNLRMTYIEVKEST